MSPLVLLWMALQGLPASQPPPPPPETPPATTAPSSAPRRIDDLSKPLTGAVPQGSYEERLRGAFSRTQSLQGPLDGAWLLKDAAGSSLYRVQLVDPGFNGGRMEGVWSDLKAGPGAAASGFLAGVAREGTRLTLQFAGVVAASLEPKPDGGFSGDLTTADGRRLPVTLTRAP